MFASFISAEVSRLNGELERKQILYEDIVGALEDARSDIKELKVELKAERNSRDAAVFRAGDQIAEFLKINTGFVKDAYKAKVVPEIKDDTPDAAEAEIFHYATELRNNDLANDENADPLEMYIEDIRRVGVANL